LHRVTETLKKEVPYLGGLFIIIAIIFQIIFSKESFGVTIRTVASLFWIFILPGFFILYYWIEKLKFVERLIIGIPISAAITGILSYYVGLMGINIKFHSLIFPPMLIFIGIYFLYKKKTL